MPHIQKKLNWPHLSHNILQNHILYIIVLLEIGFEMIKDTVAKVGNRGHQKPPTIKQISIPLDIGCHTCTKICNATIDNYALNLVFSGSFHTNSEYTTYTFVMILFRS